LKIIDGEDFDLRSPLRGRKGRRDLRLEERKQMPVRYRVDPRGVPEDKAALRLGLTPGQFQECRPRLFARNFPRPDPDTGMFGTRRRNGIISSSNSLLKTYAPVQKEAVRAADKARKMGR
jgi:hypothetical protein